jgi:hypothetical protein
METATSERLGKGFLQSRAGKKLANAIESLKKSPDKNTLDEFIKEHKKISDNPDISDITKAAINTHLAMKEMPEVIKSLNNKISGEINRAEFAERLFINLPMQCLNKEVEDELVKTVATPLHLIFPDVSKEEYEKILNETGKKVGFNDGRYSAQDNESRNTDLAKKVYKKVIEELY